MQDTSQYAGTNERYHSRGRRQKRAWRRVFWVALAVFVLSLIALGTIAFSYWQGRSAYDQVADTAFEQPIDEGTVLLSDVRLDWNALRAVNPDVVGWVRIPGTPVDYPIVRGADDVKYLTSDFQGNHTLPWGATYGTPFLLAKNAPDFSDKNNVVQAHNMNNGTMFSTIAEFTDEEKFNQYRTVYVFTPAGNYRLRSVALVQCPANEPIVRTEFASSEDFQEYVQDKISRSMVQPDGDVPAAGDIDKLFMFSTCEGITGDKRDVLVCSVEEYAALNGGGQA